MRWPSDRPVRLPLRCRRTAATPPAGRSHRRTRQGGRRRARPTTSPIHRASGRPTPHRDGSRWPIRGWCAIPSAAEPKDVGAARAALTSSGAGSRHARAGPAAAVRSRKTPGRPGRPESPLYLRRGGTGSWVWSEAPWPARGWSGPRCRGGQRLHRGVNHSLAGQGWTLVGCAHCASSSLGMGKSAPFRCWIVLSTVAFSQVSRT